MTQLTKTGRIQPRARWAGGLIIGLALAVLGATLAWAALDLRIRIRAQLIQREAEILDAVTQMQHLNDQTGGETIATLADPGEQFQLALKVSRLRNVLGVRLYSGSGEFVNAFPAYITESSLPAEDLAALKNLKPISHFSARARLAEQDLLAESNAAPAALSWVEVPLRSEEPPRLAGVIQFVMEDSSLARQFAGLDWDLALKFGIAFLVGAVILTAGLGLALRRVDEARQKLAERTENLLQANRELSLAARTTAVGAVASHLIHGLKNPLSGLRNYVHQHNGRAGPDTDTEWQAAVSSTQRMEELINRVVRVLQEQQTGTTYEMTVAELVGLLQPRAQALAEAAGVHFSTEVKADHMLSNREADLILLILENLVQNAVEATPAGRMVGLKVAEAGGEIQFEVWDQGFGLAPGQVERLFLPGNSTKKGGGGIGLAISQQLAHTVGASLALVVHAPTGSIFRLAIGRTSGKVNGSIPGQKAWALSQPN